MRIYKVEDLTGKTFGRLLVVSRAPNSPRNATRWNCICACGNKRIAVGGCLKNGTWQSCGCLRDEKLRTHGLSKHPLWSTWRLMNERCYKPSDQAYERYGGRGIKVCERWKNSIQSFIDDMGQKPPGSQLDRINNDGDYCPENCRWATPTTQANNRRSNSIIFYKGRAQTIMEWSRELGMSRRNISARYNKGWTAERIFETPISQKVWNTRRANIVSP